ncbi:MAG TPA: hypothetical protein P5290_02530 [Candidatus Methanomethylicus sp.]|nr:hypothetical protein [Candidatus Methanomethylicus sp.]
MEPMIPLPPHPAQLPLQDQRVFLKHISGFIWGERAALQGKNVLCMLEMGTRSICEELNEVFFVYELDEYATYCVPTLPGMGKGRARIMEGGLPL